MAKLSTADFISRAKIIHNSFYSYPRAKYINSRIKIIITCPMHGDFTQRADCHLRGQGCVKCRGHEKESETTIIERFKHVHDNKYNYDNVRYINMRTNVEIICPVHGSFFQRPDNHINGNECTKCVDENRRLSHNEIIYKFVNKHGNKYNYDSVVYTTQMDKVNITCPEHGIFTQRPHDHLNGRGCPKCGDRKLELDDVIIQFNKIHNNKYNYDKCNYINTRTKIKITCPYHGVFLQTPNSHKQGHGCPKCNKVGGYSFKLFNKGVYDKSKPSVLYLLKFYNKDEVFYKIGITTRSIKQRYHGEKNYAYDIVLSIDTTLYKSFCVEQSMISKFERYKYVPKLTFDGFSECFNLTETNVHYLCQSISSSMSSNTP